MSAVDVLAIMDHMIASAYGDQSANTSFRIGPNHPAIQARAAVAELIEASRTTLIEPWEIDRLRAALARCTGETK